MSYNERLKTYAEALLSEGYRGFEYAITGGLPQTARRKLCKLDNGCVVHYDAFATTEEEKEKYKDVTIWKSIGTGRTYDNLSREGFNAWFYTKRK